MSYLRFFAMIATSTFVMFVLMYLNTFLWSHVFFSETRAYMAVLMGATMAFVMLGFMLSMYSSKKANIAIFSGAILVFGASLWLVRSQITVGDESFMRAMIPHHSIAIMTSSRANLSDPRVQKLSSEIVYAQDKEIAEMRYLIADIERSGDASHTGNENRAQIVTLEQALATAEIPILDPEFISQEEVERAFPDGATCAFTYTETSPPVLVVARQGSAAVALVKISGDLIELQTEDRDGQQAGLGFVSEGISMRAFSVAGVPLAAVGSVEQVEADLRFELDAGLQAGYRGFYNCGI